MPDVLCMIFFLPSVLLFITFLRYYHYSPTFFSIQVLFKDGLFQWKRLENLIVLAKEDVSKKSTSPALKSNSLWVFDPLVMSCCTYLVVLASVLIFRTAGKLWHVNKWKKNWTSLTQSKTEHGCSLLILGSGDNLQWLSPRTPGCM